MRKNEISLNEAKITNQKKLTNKRSQSDHLTTESNLIAAVSVKNALEEEKRQKQSNTYSIELSAESEQNKQQSKQIETRIRKERNSQEVDHIVNSKWKELIPELDGAGIPINKTVKSLLKLYAPLEVRRAIALLKVRKRERHIPNPSGYFVSALKGDWGAQKGSKNLVEGDPLGYAERNREDQEIDTAAVFRHWYDLACELGYCRGQEIREGEQWINLSGSWERWADAVARGYSLGYLKKIMRRNQGQG